MPNFSHGNFFLEFGMRYKKNLSKWQKYRKNVVVPHKKQSNSYKGFENRAEIRYFEMDLKVPQESYIKRKVGAKGLEWSYIGVEWRKVAEIG